jgi:hypothetical protein
MKSSFFILKNYHKPPAAAINNHLRSSDLEWWRLKVDDDCYISKSAAGG